MKPFAAFSALLLLFTTLASSTHAQTVWRCGEGGRTYSESPCPGGQMLKAGDPRTAGQAQSAREAIKRDQDLGARMRKERLEDEKLHRAANAGAASLGPNRVSAQGAEKVKQKPKAARRHSKALPADDGTWRAAAVPSQRKKD